MSEVAQENGTVKHMTIFLVYHNGQGEVVIASDEIEACRMIARARYPHQWESGTLAFDLYVELVSSTPSGICERGVRRTITPKRLLSQE